MLLKPGYPNEAEEDEILLRYMDRRPGGRAQGRWRPATRCGRCRVNVSQGACPSRRAALHRANLSRDARARGRGPGRLATRHARAVQGEPGAGSPARSRFRDPVRRAAPVHPGAGPSRSHQPPGPAARQNARAGGRRGDLGRARCPWWSKWSILGIEEKARQEMRTGRPPRSPVAAPATGAVGRAARQALRRHCQRTRSSPTPGSSLRSSLTVVGLVVRNQFLLAGAGALLVSPALAAVWNAARTVSAWTTPGSSRRRGRSSAKRSS